MNECFAGQLLEDVQGQSSAKQSKGEIEKNDQEIAATSNCC